MSESMLNAQKSREFLRQKNSNSISLHLDHMVQVGMIQPHRLQTTTNRLPAGPQRT